MKKITFLSILFWVTVCFAWSPPADKLPSIQGALANPVFNAVIAMKDAGGEAPATLERTGSVTTFTTESSPQSINVPSDAEIIVAGFAYSYWEAVARFTAASIGSDNLSSEIQTPAANYAATELWVGDVTATGSQNFAWTNSSIDDGPIIFVAFYKGQKAGDFTLDNGGEHQAATSATTGAMTSASGDIGVAVIGAYTEGGYDVVWSLGTEVAEVENSGVIGAYAELTASGATVTLTGEADASLNSISGSVLDDE